MDINDDGASTAKKGEDEMMFDEHGRGPDVKMFSLNSELGDVKYVMSDKTGTLTQNCMRFRMCSVGGVKYANRRTRRDKTFSPKKLISHIASNQMNNAHQIREFLLACAICHTASPDKNTSNADRPLYHATSPDEHALLELAADAGFVFKRRAPGKCFVNVLGTALEYDLVAILEFDSERKRMSVIVREPGGKIKLYIKGADQKIFERLKSVSQKELKRTAGHLQQFAIGGYRTLCFAVRTIEMTTFNAWYKEYLKTINDPVKRKTRLAELAEVIEKPRTVLVHNGSVPKVGRHVHWLGTELLWRRYDGTKYARLLGEKVLSRRDQQLSLIVDATAAVTRLLKANVCGAVLAIGDGANDVAMLQVPPFS
ncbi:hypothetical protein TELCIR_16905 [Teladorsagia circumcincta]|uniref:IC domain protein, HAD ATPase, P-type family n=1 Tax=Teladorsagia circumcincta TaxID=45464 RepID=A0A2G9TUG0_TELCI|nr:hypothetical protein TELCIR_16905 [Teladorsagia circumcincta]